MRLITNLTGTLIMAGLAAYACSPRAAAAQPMSRAGITFAAQQEQTAPPKQEQAKPPKEKKPAKTSRETTKAKPAKELKNAKADKADRDQHAQQPENVDRQKENAKPQPDHAQNGRNQGGGAHGRISDSAYRAHFGQQHHFAVRRVVTTTRIVPNQTQFVYGGYTFIFLDPWPPEWAMTDDCYIDYEDGEYVLIDLAHPGVTIALEIGG